MDLRYFQAFANAVLKLIAPGLCLFLFSARAIQNFDKNNEESIQEVIYIDRECLEYIASTFPSFLINVPKDAN